MTSPSLPGLPPYASLTPIMQQFARLKAEVPDCLLFFRMGDFYELFGPDAEEASRRLEIALTARDKQSGQPIPMAGVPWHSATGYLKRLLDQGVRVAIAEQMQDPASTKGMVDRQIVRILTPGTVLEDDLLTAPAGNWLALLAREGDQYGLALVELSTASCLLAVEDRPREDLDTAAQSQALERILAIARRFGAAELLLPADLPVPDGIRPDCPFATYVPHSLGEAWAQQQVARQLGVPDLAPFDFARQPAALVAIAEVLQTITRLAPAALPSLTRFTLLPNDEVMDLDATTLKHLEVLENAGTGRIAGSLLGVLDSTITPGGRRLLRELLTLPSTNPALIAGRQEAVAELVAQSLVREQVRARLKPIRDIARIAGRAQAGLATPRDLTALGESLQILPGVQADLAPLATPLLRKQAGRISAHQELAQKLAASLDPEAPAQFVPGRVIRRGCHAELDQLRGRSGDIRTALAELEAQERARTGLKLKVGHNRVHGYYFEIPKSQKAQVPADWHPRQSLVNAERYVTQALKDLESDVLGADERAAQLELGLFRELVERVATEAEPLRTSARALAWADVLATLAQVAAEKRWVRPVTLAEAAIHLESSRHPVVEDLLGPQQFVPNDAHFEPESSQLNILTGPNMAGKSTFMRQIALCCLLHQIGSFVPAASARLGCFDRLLTRVGATDDLARGQSTFMVEMVETAQILHRATPRSLVLLDEIGRGTSTYDGLALAWAIAEYLHCTPTARALTLFATHYHELTQLADHYPGIKNWRVTLKEQDGQIVFLRRVTEGRAQKSYGVVVARLAGLPPAVVERAQGILGQLEHQRIDPQIAGLPLDAGATVPWPRQAELPLFAIGGGNE